MRQAAVLILFALPCFAAKKPPLPIFQAKVLDFTEERYNEPHILDTGIHSCVNRDYTVETATHIVVLRQSTCTPNFNQALRVVIGTFVNIQQNGNKAAILDVNGHPHWYFVFKLTRKEQ